MFRKSLILSFVFMLLAGISLPSASLPVHAKTSAVVTDPSVQDIGTQLRSMELGEIELDTSAFDPSVANGNGESGGNGQQSGDGQVSAQYQVGEEKWMVALDYLNNQYYLKRFTLRAVGTYGEVWVANDLSFPEGDPRNEMIEITDDQVQYLLNEFDNNMYPKEVEFFGEPDLHTGEQALLEAWGIEEYRDETGKTMILVDNVRDESYYDPTYPSYVAGFYSPTIEIYTDRNVMTIDAFDWANRTGPDGTRPYLYEGVFAHEFQHLLHDDYDSDEESWINEGMSDYAQYLVGYGHSDSHINFFMDHLENSLVSWEDQGGREILADYGIAYLFQLYLYDHFGENFIKELFYETKNGISGVESALEKQGINLSFKELYRNFITAVLINGKYKGDASTYQFNSVDVNPNVHTEEAYNTPGAPAWGTDFIKIDPKIKVDKLLMNGIDFFSTPWKVVEDPAGERGPVLWGNSGNLTDNHLITQLDLSNVTVDDAPALTFDTYYEIEEYWDYGMVQVSTDGGESWTSLANEHTTDILDPNGLPNIQNNLPGLTGHSGGWVTETFDLSDYAGQEILLSFRYMTDWAYQEAGWYIDNIHVDAIGFTHDADSTDGWMSLEEVKGIYTNYMVSFVGFRKGNGMVNVVHVNDLLNFTEEEAKELHDMFNDASYEYIIMMVTHAAPEGTSSYADYEYEVIEHETGPKKK